MICVEFSGNSDNITGFEVSGHAGYDEYGRDIVCAAVSALATNTANSIEQFTEDDMTVDVDEKTGLLRLTMTSTISDSSKLLLKSFKLGIESIEQAYGSEIVNILN
ncbi:MAG: ribosomal-processing cysteine protease Prp [Lachnospiraceae bacterium]|nr:ribosomal-processing cysteine protease Prp [Lachnoclostridium sp.]MDD7521998.1 ribosomal-processing cysteine protease Prp [Lachnoclostridium sp.]MDY2600031.1 ribosomal-processing cysteine protease Prp [Lachnospiraceae bacterium]